MDKYKEYKDSGIKWIKEIPSHWSLEKLKSRVKIYNGKDQKPIEIKDGKYPVLATGGEIARTNSFLHDGESVLLGRKGTIDKPKYINGKFWTVDTLFYTKIRKQLYPKFFYYQTLTIPFRLLSSGSTVPSMTQDVLHNHFLCYPLFEEQTAIANFLDEKTGAIDSAVEELENQRRLLKELKQATIHKAVTKGLDDNATMKDSGVEWIGEIPVDWEVRRLKDFFSFQMGNTIIKEDLNNEGKGLPVYSATREDKYFGFFENFNLKLKKDDIVFGARGTIGFPKICREDCTSSQTTIACIKKRPKVNSKFVHYFLMGNHEVIFSFTKTAMPQFTVNNAKEIYIVINDDEEKIVDFLDKKISKIDSSLEEIESKIEYLKEYKKTLINDAVTGKIKVYEGDV
jgi:type I restriction enzyme S subunit